MKTYLVLFFVLLSFSSFASEYRSDRDTVVVDYMTVNGAWKINESCNFLNTEEKTDYKTKLDKYNNINSKIVETYPDQKSVSTLKSNVDSVVEGSAQTCDDKGKKFVSESYQILLGTYK